MTLASWALVCKKRHKVASILIVQKAFFQQKKHQETNLKQSQKPRSLHSLYFEKMIVLEYPMLYSKF